MEGRVPVAMEVLTSGILCFSDGIETANQKGGWWKIENHKTIRFLDQSSNPCFQNRLHHSSWRETREFIKLRSTVCLVVSHNIYIYILLHIHVYTYKYTYTYTAYIYIYIYSIYVYIYSIHVYMYIYIHIYIYLQYYIHILCSTLFRRWSHLTFMGRSHQPSHKSPIFPQQGPPRHKMSWFF